MIENCNSLSVFRYKKKLKIKQLKKAKCSTRYEHCLFYKVSSQNFGVKLDNKDPLLSKLWLVICLLDCLFWTSEKKFIIKILLILSSIIIVVLWELVIKLYADKV